MATSATAVLMTGRMVAAFVTELQLVSTEVIVVVSTAAVVTDLIMEV